MKILGKIFMEGNYTCLVSGIIHLSNKRYWLLIKFNIKCKNLLMQLKSYLKK